ncbi:copper chaperone CopZ [Flavobacterium tiangeerense]|uniref:Copper chaperone CopZ n=1 Tax=Flavobacterium tiangeerense TaxID=459471 RepID=A0ABY3FLY7_9FLAO|nr:heavy-metal-associated domain-containing protein [Flavobacterium tiangeerense]TWI02151.1 copper chaperone CopZ [Flavobacterium tiangeerense]
MMKKIIVVLILVFTGFTVQAQEIKNKNAKVEFHVSGNCEMCKKRIEKAALSVSGVKSADWHMDCGTLYLIVNEQKTDLLTIQKAIAKVGHDTNEVKALQEDYEKLHTCCQYERK